MTHKIRQLGVVKLVQIQPDGMIVETGETEYFDPTRRLAADQLKITAEGVSAEAPHGETVLDIHHKRHPSSHGKPGNDVCIGFSAHYQAMRNRFGEHITDGSAGENVLIEFPEEIWLADLVTQLLFENPETGQTALLDVNRIAAPCEEFTHFAANSQHERLPAEDLKAYLQFLGEGRRGFLLSLNSGHAEAFIQPGDRVYVVGEHTD